MNQLSFRTETRALKRKEKPVEFENPKHDNPQRIRYEQTDAGITATISRLEGSRAKQPVEKGV